MSYQLAIRGALIATLVTGCAAVVANAEDIASAEEARKVDFASDVMPIFEDRCVKCHKEKNAKGDLMMHSVEVLEEIKDDYYITPGDPEGSSVYERIVLPADDDLRMPKGGDPLSKEQIETIRLWIVQGAELTSAEAAKPSMTEEAAEPTPPTPEPADPAAIAKVESLGGTVVPLYAGSPLLSVGFPSQPGDVNDAAVDAIVALGPNVTWLDLSRTAITDEGAKKLASLTNLSKLSLAETDVTDAGATSLANLPTLEILNLYGTQVTDATAAALLSATSLQKLYVWKTDVTYEAAMTLKDSREGLDVNLGWDHPGVVRARLEEELARVTKNQEEAQIQIEQAKQQLSSAEAQLKSAAEREAELKKELEALDGGEASGDEETEKEESEEETPKENSAE